MKIESVTYRFAVDREDGWPERIHKSYTKTQEYRPDHLSFLVHVTIETAKVSVNGLTVSGRRWLKDGLSEHRVHEPFFGPETDWLNPYVNEAIRSVRMRHPELHVAS